MKGYTALKPPMGWNSWDCYGATVTEEEVKGNAEYMAAHLKNFGWEYIVVDIQWYEPESKLSAYRPFVPLTMDEYSRLLPAPNRFPSSERGNGFKPLADYIHKLGLKFGIHIMRGIPRQAVHENTPIFGTAKRAREVANPNSVCWWNTDMYGVDSALAGAQSYYDSLFLLYASWGVDFVKVDDIATPYSYGEVELIRNAIDKCGREIVLSLSPGPASIEYAEHFKKHANMWRITDDFWDRWDHLLEMFERCNQWSVHTGPGSWPDADMLPLGHIAIRSFENGIGDRWTRFSKNEQVMLMTLWIIFRSPLMIGCELRDNDDWTNSLLTNEEALRVLNYSSSSRQLYRKGPLKNYIAWTSFDEDGSVYLAFFNTHTVEAELEAQYPQLNIEGEYQVSDIWEHRVLGNANRSVSAVTPPHGARFLKLTKLL